MKERPIIFSGPMVQALLAGTKTQTRRVVKQPVDQDDRFIGGFKLTGPGGVETATGGPLVCFYSPLGSPGDRLWVRENLSYDSENGHYYSAVEQGSLGNPSGRTYVVYEREPIGKEIPARSIPSIHMPRWASRITLEITSVRVERLQDISEADARAEGVSYDPGDGGVFHVLGMADCGSDSAADSYRKLWDSINGTGSWDANPWVWCISFKRVEGNKQ